MKTSNILSLSTFIIMGLGIMLIARSFSKELVPVVEWPERTVTLETDKEDTISIEIPEQIHFLTNHTGVRLFFEEGPPRVIMYSSLKNYLEISQNGDSLKIMKNQALIKDYQFIRSRENHNIFIEIYLPPGVVQSMTAINGGYIINRRGAISSEQYNSLPDPSLQLNCFSCSGMDVEWYAKEITVNIPSNDLDFPGFLQLRGRTQQLTAQIRANNYLDAQNLVAEKLDVKTSEYGGGAFYVTNYLNADLRSQNTVTYKGNPTIDLKEKHFLGKLVNVNLPKKLADQSVGRE